MISYILFRLWELGRQGFGFSGEISGIETKNVISTGESLSENSGLSVEKTGDLPSSLMAGNSSDLLLQSHVRKPNRPRPTALESSKDSPRRLRRTGTDSPLVEKTPDILPLKGLRFEAASLSEAVDNAPVRSAQEHCERAANQESATEGVHNERPSAEGIGSVPKNSRRGAAMSRPESEQDCNSSTNVSPTKKAITGN